jgi:hypothetical protein
VCELFQQSAKFFNAEVMLPVSHVIPHGGALKSGFRVGGPDKNANAEVLWFLVCFHHVLGWGNLDCQIQERHRGGCFASDPLEFSKATEGCFDAFPLLIRPTPNTEHIVYEALKV